MWDDGRSILVNRLESSFVRDGDLKGDLCLLWRYFIEEMLKRFEKFENKGIVSWCNGRMEFEVC
jgi:hypothetical protein